MTILQLVDLSKAYVVGETAVSGLNLTINEGELMVLLGPSGCGKTTTLRLIAGLLSPTAGDVLFDGESVLGVPPEKRGAVMVFQEHALFPFMSVGENVAFGLKQRHVGRDEMQERVSAALTAVQLTDFENRWPDQLSGGQQQRVALARALVIRPRLLLLDEPLSNLDRGLRRELRQMIVALQKESGITTLFVTHDQSEAVAIADRIGVMINGRLRQVGPPQAFYYNPADVQIARFFGADNFLPGMKRGQVVETGIGTIHVAPCVQPDGPVLLTIRPEAIEIQPNGYNDFAAAVRSCSFDVPSDQCRVQVNGTTLRLALPPFHQMAVNQPLMIHLPRERICVLPVAENDEV